MFNWIEVDGCIVHIQSKAPMTEETRTAVAEVVTSGNRWSRKNQEDAELVLFADRLRQLRIQADLSMGELAEMAGVSVTRISAIETLRGEPATSAERLALFRVLPTLDREGTQ